MEAMVEEDMVEAMAIMVEVEVTAEDTDMALFQWIQSQFWDFYHSVKFNFFCSRQLTYLFIILKVRLYYAVFLLY